MLVSCQPTWKKMDYDHGKLLHLEILDSAITVRTGDESFHLNVRLTNASDSAFILYGFKRIEPGGERITIYKQPYYVQSHTIIVGNEVDGPSIITVQEIPNSTPSMELDSTSFMGSLLGAMGDNMRENRLIINRHSTWTGKLKVWLYTKRMKHHERFERVENVRILGEHDLFLLYVCGVNITNLVSEKRIKKDEKENDATLFQGYTQSNVIKIIVKE